MVGQRSVAAAFEGDATYQQNEVVHKVYIYNNVFSVLCDKPALGRRSTRLRGQLRKWVTVATLPHIYSIYCVGDGCCDSVGFPEGCWERLGCADSLGPAEGRLDSDG